MKRRPALSPAESFTAWLVASVGPDHDAHAALDSILSLLTTRELAAIAGGLSRVIGLRARKDGQCLAIARTRGDGRTVGAVEVEAKHVGALAAALAAARNGHTFHGTLELRGGARAAIDVKSSGALSLWLADTRGRRLGRETIISSAAELRALAFAVAAASSSNTTQPRKPSEVP